MKKIHLYIVILSFTTISFSQNKLRNFNRLTLSDGLSQSTASSIIQDKKGYVWFGTRNGLNKYNGYNFNVYKEITGDTNSLSDNWITSLALDYRGNIWIGTLNHGAVLMDPIKLNYTRFDNSNESKTLSHLSVLDIYVDINNVSWIGTHNGFNKIEGSKITIYKFPEKFNYVNKILGYNEKLYLATDNGLYIFNPSTAELEDSNYLKGMVVKEIMNLGNRDSWIGTTDGLYILDEANKKIDAFEGQLSDNNIHSIVKDMYSNIWVGTFNGLNEINLETKEVSIYQNKQNNPLSLSNNEIRSLFVDNSNNLWIGTYGGGGINKIDLKPNKFNTINQANYPSLPNNVIRSFYKDEDENLWVGTRDGLAVKSKNSNEFNVFKTSNNANSISNNEVRKIIKYDENNLLIGTENGVNLFNTTNQNFKRIKLFPDEKDVKVYSIHKDKNSNFWIGTNGNGIFILDSDLKVLSHYHNVHIPNLKISFIEEDHLNRLWIGSFGGGIYRVNDPSDISNIKFKIYQSDVKESNAISNNVIYTFGLDLNNNIWIGTTSGLNLYQEDTDNFIFFSKNDGLPDNYIYGIQSDNKGQVWISTVNGVSRFDIINNLFKNFDKFDGLQDNEFKYNSSYKSKDGTIYFGGVNGFNYFNPESMTTNLSNPEIVISSIYKFSNNRYGKTIIGDAYNNDDVVTLAYHQNEFTIEFAALEYTQPLKNQYAYRMIGFNSDWNYVDYKRDATYTNLDPGKYTFQVKGSNNDGFWNKDGIRIHIIIEPPFWQSTWFKVLVVIALILIAFAIFRIRILSIMKQNKLLELKISEHSEELKQTQDQLIQAEKLSSLGQMMAGITHEVNTPLAYVSSNLYVLTEIFEYHEKSVKKAFDEQTFSNIEQIIESTNTGVERLTSIVKELRNFTRMDEPIFVDVNLNQIVESAIKITSHRFRKNQIEMQKSLDNSITIKGLTNQLNQVVLNLLNNACDAVKSQKEKNPELKPKVSVHIHKDKAKKLAYLEIRDNGIGIPKDIVQKVFDPYFTTKPFGKGTGLGLAISYSIIKSHKGNIDIESEVGKGSKITLSFNLP